MLERAVRIHVFALEGFADLLEQIAIVGRVFFVSKNFCRFGENMRRVGENRRGELFVGHLAVAARITVEDERVAVEPFAVVVFAVLRPNQAIRAFFVDEINPPFGGGIGALQDAFVSVVLIETPWQMDACVRPAGGAEKVGVMVDARRDVRELAVRLLFIDDVLFEFRDEGGHVAVEDGGLREGEHVGRPSHAFVALRTVRSRAEHVAALVPLNAMQDALHQFVGRGDGADGGGGGEHDETTEVVERRRRGQPADFHIAISIIGMARRQRAFPAGPDDVPKLLRAAEIGAIDGAVRIQHFAEGDADGGAARGVCRQFAKADHVLRHVEDPDAFLWIRKCFGFQDLFTDNRFVRLAEKQGVFGAFRSGDDGGGRPVGGIETDVVPIGLFACAVVVETVVDFRTADRAVVVREPTAIRDDFRAVVDVDESLQAVFAAWNATACEHRAVPPAGGDFRRDGIVAFFQK